jgi:transcriptional regulator with XRE-family HTH domain
MHVYRKFVKTMLGNSFPVNKIYSYSCYRDVIRTYVKEQGSSFRALASVSQIHTSYFSRVMAGDSEFSAEQLFKICKAMQMQEAHIDYVLLLGDLSRSSHHEHKTFLKQRIQALREEHLRLADQLEGRMAKLGQEEMENYFSDIRLAKIHMLLTIPKYRQHPLQMARRLGLSEMELNRCLERLSRIGLIRMKQATITHVEESIHLDEHHPLSLGNHKNWRIDCLHHLNRMEAGPHDYHFSATFTCDWDTKGRIKELFKETLAKAQSQVASCPRNDDAHVLLLDIY